MTIKKRIVVFYVLIILGLSVVFIILLFSRKEKKMVIEVEGFEVEYKMTDREITIEDIDGIELGSSAYEINNKLGEPDTWVGSGMPRPVYFLKDNKVVVFHFKYPAACKDLIRIVLIDENGESQILKEK